MSLVTDQAALDEYKAARTKILQSQEYATGDQSSKRALLDPVEKYVEKYQKKVDAATGLTGGIRVRGVTIDD